MDRIDVVNLAIMKNAPLNHFMSRIAAVVLTEPAVERAIGEALLADQLAFQSAIKKKGYKQGTSLKAIDQKVDQFWRGTKAQLKLSMKNPDADVCAAANEIYVVFDSFPDPTHLKTEVQYGALSALLPKLEAFDHYKLELAAVHTWIKALRDAFEEFRQLQDEKSNAKAQAELGVTKKAREKVIATYESLVERLNAIAVLHPDEEHLTLIALINQRIAEHKLSKKLGKRKQNEEGDEGEGEKAEE